MIKEINKNLFNNLLQYNYISFMLDEKYIISITIMDNEVSIQEEYNKITIIQYVYNIKNNLKDILNKIIIDNLKYFKLLIIKNNNRLFNSKININLDNKKKREEKWNIVLSQDSALEITIYSDVEKSLDIINSLLKIKHLLYLATNDILSSKDVKEFKNKNNDYLAIKSHSYIETDKEILDILNYFPIYNGEIVEDKNLQKKAKLLFG